MLQQMGAWKYRNDNSKHSARAVVQEHNLFLARTSYERRTCSHGRRVVFWGLASILVHAGHLRLLYKGELGSHWQQEHE